jgi:hypothetical protein
MQEWNLRGSDADGGVRVGCLVSRLLTGSWREPLPPFDLTEEELTAVSTLLLDTGAAALGWRRVRPSPLIGVRAADQFREFYRSHGLQAALYERSVTRVVAHLRAVGVEPLLAKGWAIARLYPEPGLRPYGDIDLCVPPEQYATAEVALRDLEEVMCGVDLHRGVVRHWGRSAFTRMNDRSLDDLYQRSQVVPAGDTEVRILSAEDHLRLLCLHLWGHGAWRPLWLCDIAVALETLPASFDWDLFLSGDRRRSEWVISVLCLAHHLLGAQLERTPIADHAQQLPHWLVPTVLRQWGRHRRHRIPMADVPRRPSRLLKQLIVHWPNGVEATADVHAPCNDWPRLPIQLAACFVRTARYLTTTRS